MFLSSLFKQKTLQFQNAGQRSFVLVVVADVIEASEVDDMNALNSYLHCYFVELLAAVSELTLATL